MPSFLAKELAERLGARLEGDPDRPLAGVQGLAEAGPDQLSFLANPRYRDQLAGSRAGAILVRPADRDSVPEGCVALVIDDPYAAFAQALALFQPPASGPGWGRHRAAVVDASAQVDAESWLGPGVVVQAGARIGRGSRLDGLVWVGEEAVIGQDCHIHAGCLIRERCVLGDRVVLQNGVVVGADGFGFAPVEGGTLKIPQTGRVVIEDDVEVGALTCLDRGTLGDTVVRRGVRLDNLIQIAHNVDVGEGTLMAAQTGVAGSTRIGAHCRIGGSSAINGHITVGDRVQIGGGSGVTGSVPDGRVYAGFPARPYKDFMRQSAALSRLPKAMDTLRGLERRLAEAEARLAALEGQKAEPKA